MQSFAVIEQGLDKDSINFQYQKVFVEKKRKGAPWFLHIQVDYVFTH